MDETQRKLVIENMARYADMQRQAAQGMWECVRLLLLLGDDPSTVATKILGTSRSSMYRELSRRGLVAPRSARTPD